MFHRIIGNISYAGFMIAAWGGWRAWRKRRRGSSLDKAYYHWVAHFGFLWGIIFELFQPIVGYIYVLQIQAGNPTTYTIMMLGDKSWAWLLQIALVGLTFVLSDLYMWLSIRRAVIERQGTRALTALRIGAGNIPLTPEELRSASILKQVMRLGRHEGEMAPYDRLVRLYSTGGLIVLVILTIIGFIPSSIPVLGSMVTKSICLIGFIIFTLLTLFLYWREKRRWTWGNMGAAAQWTLVALGAVLIVIMIVMGGIRYSNPQTGVINGTMPLPQMHVQPTR